MCKAFGYVSFVQMITLLENFEVSYKKVLCKEFLYNFAYKIRGDYNSRLSAKIHTKQEIAKQYYICSANWPI